MVVLRTFVIVTIHFNIFFVICCITVCLYRFKLPSSPLSSSKLYSTLWQFVSCVCATRDYSLLQYILFICIVSCLLLYNYYPTCWPIHFNRYYKFIIYVILAKGMSAKEQLTNKDASNSRKGFRKFYPPANIKMLFSLFIIFMPTLNPLYIKKTTFLVSLRSTYFVCILFIN